MNDKGEVAYVWVDEAFGPHKILKVSAGGIGREIGTFPNDMKLRPQISNTSEVVFRSVSKKSIITIFKESADHETIGG